MYINHIEAIYTESDSSGALRQVPSEGRGNQQIIWLVWLAGHK